MSYGLTLAEEGNTLMTSDPIEVLYRPANSPAQIDPPIPAPTPGAIRVIPAGSTQGDGALPTPIDIEVTQDLPIVLRDGVTLYGDVYRAAGTGPEPAILIYTPYVKRGGRFNTEVAVTRFGAPPQWVSGYQPFEALDPAYWSAHGYTIVVVDARGTGQSEGDMHFMGTAEGQDVYDTVEWIAAQPWCTGRVAMAGNSQLAMAQWAAAALRPPHLTAIAPWEGLTDVFREVVNRGGIPDTAFHDDFIIASLVGNGRFEDITAMLRRHRTDDWYWADKRADLPAVDIPAYVVSSWTNFIHTRTTQKAFEALRPDRTWMRVHNTHEWIDIATPEHVDDLRRFFDHYLRDEANGWADTPRVRYVLLDPGGADVLGLTADTWPPVPVTVTALHLDAAGGRLTAEPPAVASSVSYDATDPAACARFRYTADQETTLVGPLNARLWAQTSEGDDLDLFAMVYKTDATGQPLYHVTYPALKPMTPALAHQGRLSSLVAYAGPDGRLRASRRALDPGKSTALEPYLTHEHDEPVTPGTPVQVDLGLWPTGMIIHPGETLVLEIAGHPAGPFPLIQPGNEQPSDVPTRNAGAHTIPTGGQFASRLFLPIAR